MGLEPPQELSSWKEIAVYLGVSVRTAQTWERDRGLPIRRVPGGRGRIRVAPADLEVWKNATPATTETLEPERQPARPARRRRWWVGVGVLAALAGAGAVLWWPHAGAPVKWRIDRDTFIVSDNQGRDLWRKPFPSLVAAWHSGGRNVWIGDLDGDGRNEVLFAPWSGRPEAPVGPLFCYNDDGRERWRFTPGRTLRTIGQQFDPPYSVYGIGAGRLGRDGRMRVVVSSGHFLHYPAQVTLLNPGGQAVREYWHAGHLQHILITDLDGDRKNDLLLAGTNNPAKTATLLVLDPDQPSGALPEDDPTFRFQALPRTNPAARLLFPRSCLNTLLEPFAHAVGLWREPNDITLDVQHNSNGTLADVYYHLNNDLTIKSMNIGSNFEATHHRLYTTGALDHELNNNETAKLRNILRSTPSR